VEHFASIEDKVAANASDQCYRCEEKDVLLCKSLSSITSGFLTIERLREVCHGFDTQANKSSNDAAAWKAPKGKTPCRSISLENRVQMATATRLIGQDNFALHLCDWLGVECRPGMGHCLKLKGKAFVK